MFDLSCDERVYVMNTCNEYIKKSIVNFKNKIQASEKIILVVKGVLMGAMLIAIFIHLLNSELTSAPEFIYNQF